LSGFDIGIILIYLAGMLAVGIYANRRQTSMEDYYVAGRSCGTFPIMCLWMSAWIGGASITGTSAKAYDMGITAIWYVLIIAIGTVLFAVVMTKPAKRIGDRLKNITFPDFIESRYDSKTRAAATITTILAYIAYTASQFVAGASILSVLTGWPLVLCFVVTTLVIVVYTSIGGFLAVAYTDMVQMILLVMGIVILAVPVSMHVMSTENLSFSTLPESYFNLGTWGWPTIIALGLSTIFSFFTSMDSYTKVFAARDDKVVFKGTMLAAAGGAVIAVSATYLGLVARVAIPGLDSGAGSMAALVLQKFPIGVKGLVLVAIMAAIMSTGDVCVLTVSSNVTRDIYQRYLNPNASERKLMVLSIVSSLVVGALSALFAWYKQDIVDVLFIAFTINSAGLFLPTILGIFWKRSNSTAAFASIITSLIIVLGWYIGGAVSSLPIFAIDALWPAFGLSAAIYLVLCLTCSPSETEREKIELFFESK
jgi:SSS family solute:Na+ symporter